MKIGLYISELLFEHESVIMPGIGEFYTRYIPARFIPEEKKVESPRKLVAFQPEPANGPSPLTTLISRRENMTEQQVVDFLGKIAAEMRDLLNQGQKISLERIGILSQDEAGHLLFDADETINYLDAPPLPGQTESLITANTPEAVSMNSEEEAPAQPAQVSSSQEVRASEATVAPQAVIETEKNRIPPAARWIAFTVVPLLVIIIILMLNFRFFFGENGLFTAGKKSQKIAETEQYSTEADQGGQSVAAVEEAYTLEKPAGSETQEAPSSEALVRGPDTPASTQAAASSGKKYYLVTGSFRDEASANAHVEQLKAKGATGALSFMRTPTGYYRVAWNVYHDLQQAEDDLKTVQQQINPEAWILHR